jgi:hypothetical protein
MWKLFFSVTDKAYEEETECMITYPREPTEKDIKGLIGIISKLYYNVKLKEVKEAKR